MFSDETYMKQTKELISQERAKIYRQMKDSSDFKPYPPSANFLLVKILREDMTSQDFFDRAIRKGLMIRDCSTFPFLDQKFIRFCFMMPEDNERLLQCLLR